MNELTVDILRDVRLERESQDRQWGDQKHGMGIFYQILGEEYGEVGRAMLDCQFNDGTIAHLREELVQVAAVAVKMIELIDRDLWPKD